MELRKTPTRRPNITVPGDENPSVQKHHGRALDPPAVVGPGPPVCPPPSPPPLGPGLSWWRETSQIWQRQKSRLDKCERFSAGLLEPSSFPLCQQVEKFLRPYRVLGSGLEALVGVMEGDLAFSPPRGSRTTLLIAVTAQTGKIPPSSRLIFLVTVSSLKPPFLSVISLLFSFSLSRFSAFRRSTLYYVT